MEVVHLDLGIVVIAAVAIGVEGGDAVLGGILHDGAFAPCVVGVLGDGLAVLVGDGDDVALNQVYISWQGMSIRRKTAAPRKVRLKRVSNKSEALLYSTRKKGT